MNAAVSTRLKSRVLATRLIKDFLAGRENTKKALKKYKKQSLIIIKMRFCFFACASESSMDGETAARLAVRGGLLQAVRP